MTAAGQPQCLYKGALYLLPVEMIAHGDERLGKWRGNWRMECVSSTLHTISEHGVSIITTADVHTSAASSRLNWRPSRFKWTRQLRKKTKYGFCACAITFQTQSTYFVFVALGIQHATRMLRVILSSVACPSLPYISILSQKLRFSGGGVGGGGEGVTEHKMCVLIFSTTIV